MASIFAPDSCLIPGRDFFNFFGWQIAGPQIFKGIDIIWLQRILGSVAVDLKDISGDFTSKRDFRVSRTGSGDLTESDDREDTKLFGRPSEAG